MTDRTRSGSMEALRGAPPARVPAGRGYPDLLALKSGDQYRLMEIGHIDWISAEDKYVRIHTGDGQRLLQRPLSVLEVQYLDPAVFVRIHRSIIVNLRRVQSFETLSHGQLAVVLKDGTRLVCSRRYRDRLRERVLFLS
jgi:two-component system LytT family response regulator